MRFQLDPNLDALLFERMIGELCKEGRLTRTEKGYCIPNLVVNLPSYQKKLIEDLVQFCEKQGYGTFSAGTYWKLHGEGISYRDVEKVLDHLHAQKKLVRLRDGRFLTVQAFTEIKEKVRAVILQKGSLTLQEGEAILGYGRNRAVPVLDYLDSTGFTRRTGNDRILGR